ncbi:hypothetical protein MLD38_024867 [Melastoma candidum]|uniref:Uncharacterized protein n=1 Tax=Melastoma candidum TaxID=119954 RepID=A0ACB9NTL7_9MYRT|nr:hypothetical protein MLD38_024867 [Melastoma candidum]
MGGCFSYEFVCDDYGCPGTVRVITIGGDLREYCIPVTAAQVLRSGSFSATSSAAAARFVCSSDMLLYDEFVPTLDPEEELVDGQIYFVLPGSRLRQRLTASDMAALAVKANLAIQKAEGKRGKRQRRRETRVSLSTGVNRKASSFISEYASQPKRTGAGTESCDEVQMKAKMMSRRSESFRRLRKYPSRRLGKAMRSFKIRLSTIHEGTVDVDVEL